MNQTRKSHATNREGEWIGLEGRPLPFFGGLAHRPERLIAACISRRLAFHAVEPAVPSLRRTKRTGVKTGEYG